MATKSVVQLGEQQRRELRAMIATGRGPACALIHARILLKADRGESDPAIAHALEVSRCTVERVRRRFVQAGLSAALQRLPQPARSDKRKLDGDAEALYHKT